MRRVGGRCWQASLFRIRPILAHDVAQTLHNIQIGGFHPRQGGHRLVHVSFLVACYGLDSLLVNFTEKAGASVIIRGLRAVSDFEYEFQMAAMNSRLNQGVETVFLMAADKYQFISSRLVKEVGELGGNISHFVSEAVKKRLDQRFSSGSP